MRLKFTSLIPAVKYLRDMLNITPELEATSALSLHTYIIRVQAPGLKDCKDFVEACMIMGVKRYLDDPKAFEERFGKL